MMTSSNGRTEYFDVIYVCYISDLRVNVHYVLLKRCELIFIPEGDLMRYANWMRINILNIAILLLFQVFALLDNMSFIVE